MMRNVHHHGRFAPRKLQRCPILETTDTCKYFLKITSHLTTHNTIGNTHNELKPLNLDTSILDHFIVDEPSAFVFTAVDYRVVILIPITSSPR